MVFDPSKPLQDSKLEDEAQEQAELRMRVEYLCKENAPAPEPEPPAKEKCGYRAKLSGKVCVKDKGHVGPHDLQKPSRSDND